VATGFDAGTSLRWNLYQSDFLTADAGSRCGQPALAGHCHDWSMDAVTVSLQLPADPDSRASRMAELEMIDVTPAEAPARVVINSRTGTVVINSAVRLYPAAISHGKLTVRIDESPTVVQPAPFSRGETTVQQDSKLDAQQDGNRVVYFKPGASLAKLVDALNLLGVSPPDLVAILEALKQAGALKAEVVVI
jgi:flagellar P-ring protein precursor FlgI